MENPDKAKQAAAKTLTTITDDCGNVLAFLQDVAVKCLLVIIAPLSRCADKCARVWFQRWTDIMEAAILHGESDAVEILNIFARSITKWVK